MLLSEVPPPLPPRLPSRLTSSSNRPLPASDRSLAGSSDLSASRSQDGATVLPRGAQAGYARTGRASGGGDANYDNFAAARTLGKDKVSLKEGTGIMQVPVFFFLHCKLFDTATREAKEGWPMLTETEVNGDSKSTNERGPSLVGSLGLSCRYNRFLSCLGCSSRPRTKKLVSSFHHQAKILNRKPLISTVL
jgi:hypothetical protein